MRNGHHPETPPDGSGQTSVVLAAEIRRTYTLLDTASTRVAVLRRPGCWRRAPSGYHPVLDRWLALPSETVRERVATAVMRADIDQAPFTPQFRVSAATQAVLYDLEQEHGIDEYCWGPQRPVRPSWLVGSGA